MDRSDQKAKITIVQEQGLPRRGASVLPDLSAPQYHIPRPPPPPLFSTSSQAHSSARKRSREAAFGGDASPAHSLQIRPNHRPRLVTNNEDHDEYAPIESVEHDSVEQDGHVSGRRRGAPIDLTQDSRWSTSQRAANVGHGMADHRTFADVEPKSESPDPQASLQNLKPTRFSLEVLESAATTTQNKLNPPSTQVEEQYEALLERRDAQVEEQCEALLERRDAQTPRQSLQEYPPGPPSRKPSASRRAVALRKESVPEVMRHGSTANTPLQNQSQVQTWPHRPNAPITPPSDVSPADTRGRLSHPALKSVTSSVRATSASNKFKPTVPRWDVSEPQSSIEDSQMSPRSKKKSTLRADAEATSTKQAQDGSRSMPNTGKAKLPLNEMARSYDRDTPIALGKRPRNEPDDNWDESLSVLGHEDDHQLQSHQGIVHRDLTPPAAFQDTFDEEESTDQSVPDTREKNETLSEASSKIGSMKYASSRPALADDESASLSRESSGSVDHTDNDSNKENHAKGSNRRPTGMQVHEPIVDAEMEDAVSGDEVNPPNSGSRGPNERPEGVEMSIERIEAPPTSRNKQQTTIDILNGGGSIGNSPSTSGDAIKYGQSLGTAAKHSIEGEGNGSIATDRNTNYRRKKKSHTEGGTSQLEAGIGPLQSEVGKDEPERNIVTGLPALLGGVQHVSSVAQARSEVETPTSTGSAGDQLQESLQAYTQERAQNTKVAVTPRDESRFPIPSTAREDSRPICTKVYQGVVRANEGSSALIELHGVKGNPCGFLHRNGISQIPFKGSVATKLSLGQMVKVKVATGSVPKGKDAIVKLSMLGVDQITREFISSSLDEPHEPTDDRRNLSPEPGSPANASSSEIRLTPNQASQMDNGNAPADDVKERREEGLQGLNHEGTDDRTTKEVEIIHAKGRASTPENEGQQEPRFGLGFTNTPRKRKQRAASIDEADSVAIPTTAKAIPDRKQMSVEFQDAPLADDRRDSHSEAQEINKSEGGATQNLSTPRPKTKLKKTHSKAKLRDKPSKLQDSAEIRGPQARQDTTLPLKDNKASTSKPDPGAGLIASLPTNPLTISKMNVQQEEYIALPPKMTREKYLALRDANAEAIARRNAAAGGIAGTTTVSGSANARPEIEPAKSTVKKQTKKPVSERSLSDFETPLLAVQTSLGKTSEDRRKSVQHTVHDGGLEPASIDQKHATSGREGINGKGSEDDRVLFPMSKLITLREEGHPTSAESPALDSQTTATPTPPRPASPTPTQASNAIPPTVRVRSSSKPNAQVANPRPQPVRPIPTKSASAKTPLSSKAQSMAEYRAQKEAAKKLTKASSSALHPHKSTSTVSTLRTAPTLGSDSDESESESESESSSEDPNKRKSGATAIKRKAFQKVVSRPDPAIRDRSMSVDVDDDDDDEEESN